MSEGMHCGILCKEWLTEDRLKTVIELSRVSAIGSRMLRELLKPLLPEHTPIDAAFLSNIRLKVKRILEQRDAQGYYDSAPPITGSALGGPEGTRFVRNQKIYIDEASSQASALLKEVLASGSATDAQRMLSYLTKLHNIEPGFSFRISYGTDGRPCGYVWQTPAMRAAFEQFGDVLFLDMMKRQSNSLHWPYSAVTLMDGDKKITVACESIVRAEQLESYAFIIEACLDMAPERTRESLKVFFGDGIMSERLLEMLGIKDTCKLVRDWHHLDTDWQKYFGIQLYAALANTLKDLKYSPTVDDYKKNPRNSPFITVW
jgi:hypothetical protein